MDDKLFECAVCLDLCRQCINCVSCNQIMCKAHVPNLSSCPVCRDAPFRFQENIALQRIIRDIMQRRGIESAPASPREPASNEPCGRLPGDATPPAPLGLASFFQRVLVGQAEQPGGEEDDVNMILESERATANSEVARETSLGRIAGAEPRHTVDPRHGLKVELCSPRAGQFKKQPTTEHEANMKSHTRSCTNPKCQGVWRGPWGSFIGGARGRTHFDLTKCPEGKRLNRLIGWDYDDPAF